MDGMTMMPSDAPEFVHMRSTKKKGLGRIMNQEIRVLIADENVETRKNI